MVDITVSRIERIIYYFIRITILIAIISSIINQNWVILFISVLSLFFTFLPVIIERNYKIDLPTEFEIIIVLFIYAGLFLGEVHKYYTKFWWWDVILHTTSGILFGFLGFLILFILYHTNKIKAKPFTIAIFSFSFALAIGTIWEIFEFSMDYFFGLNMQKSGLADTMGDLIVNSLGALFTSIIGFIYLKGRKTYLFDKLLKRFIMGIKNKSP